MRLRRIPARSIVGALFAASLWCLSPGPRAAAAGEDGSSPLQLAQAAGEKRFGLSEAERQRVFREVGAALNRAMQEADERYKDDPQSMQRVMYEEDLSERYKREIAKEHGLTRAQLVELGIEGFEKDWRVDAPSEVRTSVP